VVDNSAEDISLYLYSQSPDSISRTSLISQNTSALASSPDAQKVTVTGNPILTTDSTNLSYSLNFDLKTTDNKHQIVGARIRYTPATASQSGVKTKNYSGRQFRPTSSALTYSSLGSGIYAISSETGRSFSINLDLPNGVLIRKINFFFRDNSNGYFEWEGLSYMPQTSTFKNYSWGTTTYLAPSMDFRTITFPWPPVYANMLDLSTRNYRYLVSPTGSGTDLVLTGARVEYYYLDFVFVPQLKK
jgi:hypothetical protein